MKRYTVTVNGKAYDVSVDEVGAGAPAAAGAGAVKVNAPMPGNILDVKVKAGESVSEGQPLVILEAMKMENDIVAPKAGVVAAVHVKKGDVVNSNDLLVSLD
ncbi:biotin/lipoyl-containing protein [Provencibacterium massiliense]|uniref:biotin/lipoyl-containing protein n=1 Tax=Provencibacterium massiliense TaxID=1841868 RepID=UPI0009A5A43D|nr:biotin/lipoyl-containing protein [Provencibacterium massiliense]